MRKRILILAIALVLIAADVVLANLPGPVPTAQAISNVEHDPTFLSLTSSKLIYGVRVNGTYSYVGYSNDPDRDFTCINTLYSMWLHYVNPVHEYATTTLFFAVQFEGTPLPNGTTPWLPLNLFVVVNPNSGHIYGYDESPICV